MAEPRWIWQCDRLIPSQPGAGEPVTVEILEQLREQGWTKHDLFCVQLAMEEALANAIQHGNQLDTAKQVHILCQIAPERVHIEITDEGEGFDPASVPDPTEEKYINCPRGRGVMLIRNFMSRVHYNPVGNRIVLEKDRVCP